MTSVPAPTFGPNGFQVPSQADVLAGVQADINAAFGGDLNPALESPQGQLATSEAAVVGNTNDTFLKFTQQVDPAYADGRMQDGIARIYFLERNPAQPTVVQATCSGLAGTVIPELALAQAADGNLYASTAAGTIGVGGTVVIPFACTVAGPITCAAGALATIYQAIPGWDSITNAADGVIGNNVEGRSAFEARRRASVALNSRGSLPSVRAAVLAVPNVLDAYATENATGSPVTIQGVVLAAHSLYVAVVGGDLDAVALAIWSKKAPGCGYNGNTTKTVVDSNSGYHAPLPSYQVTFEVPAALAILFAVNIANNSQVPADAATQIQNAIVAAFAGEDGGPRAQIGATVYASRFYAPIAALGSWAQIISIQIGSTNVPGASFTGAIAGTALTVSAVTGAIAIGQTVSGAGVTVGTTIVSGSGASWVVSSSQTVASTAMKSVAPALNSVAVQIDQVPTVAVNEIAVTLT